MRFTGLTRIADGGVGVLRVAAGGEEHTTRADEPLVAIVVETPQVPAGD